MSTLSQFFEQLQRGPACLVTVQSARGSVPRGPGTWMAVFAQTLVGTIGGGQLEFQATIEARRRLALQATAPTSLDATAPALPMAAVRYALGPNLGQCCGGEVFLRYEPVSALDIASLKVRLHVNHPPVALFGGGHVGAALVQVFGTLPLCVTWVDSRDEIFAACVPDNVCCEHSDPVHAAVNSLQPGSIVLIMSFSHAEDLDIVAACLMRKRVQNDLPFVGLIGSQTKWASFGSRLLLRGFTAVELAGITCPIGIQGIAGKEPQVIAISVAAQILQTLNMIKP